jgi:hypothetical protein
VANGRSRLAALEPFRLPQKLVVSSGSFCFLEFLAYTETIPCFADQPARFQFILQISSYGGLSLEVTLDRPTMVLIPEKGTDRGILADNVQKECLKKT